MTPDQIAKRLRMVGATETESRDLAEVMHINGWHAILATKPSKQLLDDVFVWWVEWRAEKRALAAEIRKDRSKRLIAGYNAAPIESPVHLGGETAW